mmetsp:Transcript_4721/g.16917  ORF Transcript_4721/g.16917 Transcript_4721/m.16917 type:complete len:331 (+) Transcript_4721:973-1965(+)
MCSSLDSHPRSARKSGIVTAAICFTAARPGPSNHDLKSATSAAIPTTFLPAAPLPARRRPRCARSPSPSSYPAFLRPPCLPRRSGIPQAARSSLVSDSPAIAISATAAAAARGTLASRVARAGLFRSGALKPPPASSSPLLRTLFSPGRPQKYFSSSVRAPKWRTSFTALALRLTAPGCCACWARADGSGVTDGWGGRGSTAAGGGINLRFGGRPTFRGGCETGTALAASASVFRLYSTAFFMAMASTFLSISSLCCSLPNEDVSVSLTCCLTSGPCSESQAYRGSDVPPQFEDPWGSDFFFWDFGGLGLGGVVCCGAEARNPEASPSIC